MMKDVIIKIDQNSMVYKQETVLGISYEKCGNVNMEKAVLPGIP